MAFPDIGHPNPTPKRVAAHLMDVVISCGIADEIAALEAKGDAKLSPKQHDDVVRHYTAFAERIRRFVLGPTMSN